jgi:hypothetical protein
MIAVNSCVATILDISERIEADSRRDLTQLRASKKILLSNNLALCIRLRRIQ